MHALRLTDSAPMDIFYANTLIGMYSRFGRPDLARNVFDEMPHRNVPSWNNMVSGYVRAGLYGDAVGLFSDMRDRGIEASGRAVASVVTACSRSEGMLLHEGLQIHCFVTKNGSLHDVFVGTSLLNFYGAFGFASLARSLFEEMPNGNDVSWTSLMAVYSTEGDANGSFKMYHRMRVEGVTCNESTFLTMIGCCNDLEDELLAYQIIGQICKSGFLRDVSVANSLITMLSSFANISGACNVFNHMVERDIISWNSMVSAYAHSHLCKETFRCFSHMRYVHHEVDATGLSSLLSACRSMNNVMCSTGIHGLAVRLGLDSNISVCNMLISMYSKAGKSGDAELLFRGMPELDLVSWNSMMACYVEEGKCVDALKILAETLWKARTVDCATLTSALAACSSPGFSSEGKAVHGLAIVYGIHNSLIIGNALVTMYGRSSMMGDAKRVSQTMPMQNEVTWNALIGGHAQNEEAYEAVKAFKQMRESLPANAITLIHVLGACLTPEDLPKHGMPIHAYLVQTGFESNDYVKNSLITMYGKCGDLSSSSSIFDALEYRSTDNWNAMVAAHAHHGCREEALKLFTEMQSTGVELSHFSISACFSAAAHLAELDGGQQLHSLAMKLGLVSNIHVTNAAMDMYGKCGEITDVLKILPSSCTRTRYSWSILIASFSRRGDVEKARETFHEMLKLGPRPDSVTFVSLLSACSHGGLVDEGLAYFSSMSTDFGVVPGIEHCACIVDLLGRAGRISEAENFIRGMSVPPKGFLWRSLLVACGVHGDLETGERAAKKLVELEPSDDSAYVLYSNICAASGRYGDVEDVRREMASVNIKKKPACSWVNMIN